MKNLIDKVRIGLVVLAIAGAIPAGVGGALYITATSEKDTIKKIKAEQMVERVYLEKLNSRIRIGGPLFVYGFGAALVGGIAVDILDKKRKKYG